MSETDHKKSARQTPEGFVFVREVGGISEYTLESNGLTILVMENHTTPVATVMVTYRVGSRNEAVGYTGSTHILEHMMFKGSKNFNEENSKPFWKVIESTGAELNGTTWKDRTNYYETLPIRYLEEAIALEADRMRNLLLRKSDLDTEMTVVRNEYERKVNDPVEMLELHIWSTAFQAHPYHHSTIGWKSDIENVSIDRLKDFYDTFYWPNNATVTVLGDIDMVPILNLVKKYFGHYSSSPNQIPGMHVLEPKQEGPRKFILNRTESKSILGIAHKIPPGLHGDIPALIMLGNILGGGRRSRLYRKFIDRGLATDVVVLSQPYHDSGLFETYVTVAPGVALEKIEKMTLSEYAAIQKRGVTSKELDRTKAQVRASMTYSRDGTFSIAGEINEAIAMGDWAMYVHLPEAIERVTGADVKRVAETYLIKDQSTTGWFVGKK